MSPSVAGSNYLDKSHRYTGMGEAAREAPGDEGKPSRVFPHTSRLQGEAHRVLADGDHVAVGQLLFDHRLAVDQRAVGAPEVADPEEAVPHIDPAVVTGGRRVPDHNFVVRRTADAHHLARQRHDATRKWS